jgi:O-antigen ligase
MKGRASLGLLSASILAGGLRHPLLGALGAAAAAGLAAYEAPLALGPAIWWLPWIGWAGFSCFESAQPWAGLPVIARWSAFAIFLALAAKWDERARRLWLAGTCALGAVLAAAAVATGAGVGFGSTMTGLLPPYYNYTAFVLAAAAAAAASWALSAEPPKGLGRTALWTLVIGLIVCLLLARSRGGLIGLSAAAGWLTWRRGGMKVLLVVIAAVVVAAALAPAAWKDAAFKRTRSFAEARPKLWLAAGDLATGSPWFGEGPGNFSVGFLRQPVRSTGGAANWGLWTPYAHSEPLQAAAETGLVGLALWLLGFGATLFEAFGARADRDAAQVAARAALIAVLPQLLMDNMLQVPGLAFFCASLLAVSRPPSSARGISWTRAPALALAAFALAAAAPGLLAAPAAAGADLDERLIRAGRAVRIFPTDAYRREDLAQTLEEAGRGPEALQQWSAASGLAPFNAIYPWRSARLSPAAAAEPLLRRTLELEPGFISARVDHVLVLRALGRRDEERAELEELSRRTATPTPPTMSGYERTIVRRLPADLARVGIKFK